MKATLQIGPIRWNQRKPPDHDVKIDLKLEEKEGHWAFSCVAYVHDGQGILVAGGQCRERLFAKPDMAPYAELGELWRDYHLNDLTPGSPRQMAALAAWRKKRQRQGEEVGGFDYDEACAFLKKKGLYADSEYFYHGKPYVYGTAWLVRDIPPVALARIQHWIDAAKKTTKRKKGTIAA